MSFGGGFCNLSLLHVWEWYPLICHARKRKPDQYHIITSNIYTWLNVCRESEWVYFLKILSSALNGVTTRDEHQELGFKWNQSQNLLIEQLKNVMSYYMFVKLSQCNSYTVQCSETHNKICVVDTENLYRPTFFHTENPQESVRDLIKNQSISRTDNGIDVNKILSTSILSHNTRWRTKTPCLQKSLKFAFFFFFF